MDKDQIFLDVAEHIAQFSKCVSYKVGTIITRDDRILSTGYNGTPAGFDNCCDVFPDYHRLIDRKRHHEFSDSYEIHSELNAILWAARNGVSVEGGTLYCTNQPCWNCSKNIIQSGIIRVVYRRPYDMINEPDDLKKFFERNNIDYLHLP